MRRAKAQSSSCLQVILVYVHPFLFHSSAAKNCKKSLKSLFWVSGSFKVIGVDTIKNTSPVLVMIGSTSVPICNRFRARQANSAKITTFRGVPQPRAQASLNVSDQDLDH